jgi:hypothetical protein
MASGTIGKLNFNGIGKVKILQKKFTELFKATRLAIYEDPENEVLADGDATIASVSSKPLPPGTELGINPMIKVSTFEKKMANDYGLSVRILDSSTLAPVDGSVLLNTLRGQDKDKIHVEDRKREADKNEVKDNETMNKEEMDRLKIEFKETDDFLGRIWQEGGIHEDFLTGNIFQPLAFLYRHLIDPELEDPDDLEYEFMSYMPSTIFEMIEDKKEKEQFVQDYRHLVQYGCDNSGANASLDELLEKIKSQRQ